MPDLSLVIFDCDGVLVDSEIIAVQVEQALLGEAGYHIDADTLIARFCGMSWPEILHEIERDSGLALTDRLLGRTEALLDQRLEAEVQAVDGVAGALERIPYARCICSNSRMARLKLMLGKVGLLEKFAPNVFSAMDLGPGRAKPRPDIFLHGAARMGTDPAQVVVVEDSVHGVHAARTAGMQVIGFTGGSHTYPDHAANLTRAGAGTIVSRMQDLPATIQSLAAARDQAERPATIQASGGRT